MCTALTEHVSLFSRTFSVILLFHWFELKKLVSDEDAPSVPLRWEDKYRRMLMILDLMENRFYGA